jgi:hypothetical protein
MGVIIATSPGDIVVEFKAYYGGSMKGFAIPVKSISASKSMDVSHEYGLGSHQAYADVVGKIGYEGDFTIGSWFAGTEDNPSTWNWLIREFLTYQGDEGLPREFTINIHARYGQAMARAGTGTYGSREELTGEGEVAGNPQMTEGQYSSNTGETDGMIIESYLRCILKGDAVDIPEVGGTVSKKYPFSCLIRNPK